MTAFSLCQFFSSHSFRFFSRKYATKFKFSLFANVNSQQSIFISLDKSAKLYYYTVECNLNVKKQTSIQWKKMNWSKTNGNQRMCLIRFVQSCINAIWLRFNKIWWKLKDERTFCVSIISRSKNSIWLLLAGKGFSPAFLFLYVKTCASVLWVCVHACFLPENSESDQCSNKHFSNRYYIRTITFALNTQWNHFQIISMRAGYVRFISIKCMR